MVQVSCFLLIPLSRLFDRFSIHQHIQLRIYVSRAAAHQLADVAQARVAVGRGHMHGGGRKGRIVGLQPPRRRQQAPAGRPVWQALQIIGIRLRVWPAPCTPP